MTLGEDTFETWNAYEKFKFQSYNTPLADSLKRDSTYSVGKETEVIISTATVLRSKESGVIPSEKKVKRYEKTTNPNLAIVITNRSEHITLNDIKKAKFYQNIYQPHFIIDDETAIGTIRIITKVPAQ
jgi:esterase/lipase